VGPLASPGLQVYLEMSSLFGWEPSAPLGINIGAQRNAEGGGSLFAVAEAGPAAALAEAGAEAGFRCNVYISLRDEGP
jgi:hypothetical protein